MANERVECLAVAHLEMELFKSMYLVPNISRNDKTPSWDGDVFLYKHKGQHKKSEMIGRIPIQVKGITVREFTESYSHAFSFADLQNYYNDKGCLYFVIQIHEATHKFRVYYKELPLLELKKILDVHPDYNSEGTISIPLAILPNQVKKMEAMVFTFYNNMKKQMVVPSMKSLPSIKDPEGNTLVTEISALDAEGKNPFEVLTQEPRYLYNETTQGTAPLKEGKFEIQVEGEHNLRVSVDGEEYYDKITVHYEKGETLYRIGGSFEFKIDDESVKYRVNLCDSLRQRIDDLRFILAASAYGSLTVGNKQPFDVRGLSSDEDYVRSWKEQYQAISIYKQVLDKMGVTEDLQLYKLAKREEYTLWKLIDSVLHDEWFYSREELHTFFICPMSNLQVLIGCQKEENEGGGYRYKFMPPTDKRITLLEDNNLSLISFIARQNPKSLLQISNLDWAHQVDQYERLYKKNPEFQLQEALQDLITILNQCDAQQNYKVLVHLLPICEWLRKKCRRKEDKYSADINRLQILRRMRTLTEEENDELAGIIAKSKLDVIKYEAYLLLDDFTNAKYIYKQMSKELQELLDSHPISHFKR